MQNNRNTSESELENLCKSYERNIENLFEDFIRVKRARTSQSCQSFTSTTEVQTITVGIYIAASASNCYSHRGPFELGRRII